MFKIFLGALDKEAKFFVAEFNTIYLVAMFEDDMNVSDEIMFVKLLALALYFIYMILDLTFNLEILFWLGFIL